MSNRQKSCFALLKVNAFFTSRMLFFRLVILMGTNFSYRHLCKWLQPTKFIHVCINKQTYFHLYDGAVCLCSDIGLLRCVGYSQLLFNSGKIRALRKSVNSLLITPYHYRILAFYIVLKLIIHTHFNMDFSRIVIYECTFLTNRICPK